MNIYVRLNGENVIEACEEKLKGDDVIEVACTESQLEEIKQRFDAKCDGHKITDVTSGANAKAHIEKLERKDIKNSIENEVLSQEEKRKKLEEFGVDKIKISHIELKEKYPVD